MKVLVTGATGNVGFSTCNALIKRGVEVVATTSDLRRSKNLFSEEIELRKLDFYKPDTFKNVLDGIDKVFLMRPPKIGDPKVINCFIDKAVELGVNHFTFLSLLGIEKNPIPPHYKIEKHLQQVNATYTSLRPSFFMQNLTGAHLEDILKHDDLFIPSGKAKLSFIDTNDIGEVAAVTLIEDGHENKGYTLTGSESLNYYDVADIMTDVLGRKITYSKPGLLKFRREMLSRGQKKEYVNVLLLLNIMTRLGTAKLVTDEIDKILGRRPITMRQFVEEHKALFNQKE
ncbi:SDR family oxidoreductase [Haloplasma contractile]|uniref:Short-chain dehydrogenase-oxidoreductaseatypical SDR family TMR protein n=1 Tax=Haloplasma contractile SSD-17B TaxID=1033810 RepID=U2DYT9_9MOLU|nr:SDR family oxidoreductase [Haloplasma contractile]ERJ13407.1 Short-chain dehydrogenase-oxidoreductaseatypical SDR family TMR protein [Haloplasma contractile SSD-17B]